MGAYAEIAKVHSIIEKTRAKNFSRSKPKIDHILQAELREREARILKRLAAEEAELMPDRPPRPLMFNPALSSDSAQSA